MALVRALQLVKVVDQPDRQTWLMLAQGPEAIQTGPQRIILAEFRGKPKKHKGALGNTRVPYALCPFTPRPLASYDLRLCREETAHELAAQCCGICVERLRINIAKHGGAVSVTFRAAKFRTALESIHQPGRPYRADRPARGGNQ